MPEFIGSDASKEWPQKFEKAGLPVLGDDIKSQVGATILHRTLVKLCLDRGAIVDETYQLNLGGDTDFQNMTVESRLKSKRISKTEAVTSLVPYALANPHRTQRLRPVPGKQKNLLPITQNPRFRRPTHNNQRKTRSRRLPQQRRSSHRPHPSSKNRLRPQNRRSTPKHAIIRVQASTCASSRQPSTRMDRRLG